MPIDAIRSEMSDCRKATVRGHKCPLIWQLLARTRVQSSAQKILKSKYIFEKQNLHAVYVCLTTWIF